MKKIIISGLAVVATLVCMDQFYIVNSSVMDQNSVKFVSSTFDVSTPLLLARGGGGGGKGGGRSGKGGGGGGSCGGAGSGSGSGNGGGY